MGNGVPDATAVQYPAAFGQGIIAVGGTDAQDRWVQGAFTATRGQHVDLAAGAKDVYLCKPEAPGDYAYENGTSFATAQVTGAGALLLARASELEINLDNDDVEGLLKSSTDDVEEEGWDDKTGTGRLNIWRALTLLEQPGFAQETAGPGGVEGASSDCLEAILFAAGDFEGVYSATRHRVTKDVTFSKTYSVPPHVWGRGVNTTGYALEEIPPSFSRLTIPYYVNWGMGWCQPVAGSITTTGCTLETYVYRVSPAGSDCTIGPPPHDWVPCDPSEVVFAYTVVGPSLIGTPSIEVSEGAPALFVASVSQDPLSAQIELGSSDLVQLTVYDVLGRRVGDLVHGDLPAGRHSFAWRSRNGAARLSPGVYFVRLETSAGSLVARTVVVP